MPSKDSIAGAVDRRRVKLGLGPAGSDASAQRDSRTHSKCALHGASGEKLAQSAYQSLTSTHAALTLYDECATPSIFQDHIYTPDPVSVRQSPERTAAACISEMGRQAAFPCP